MQGPYKYKRVCARVRTCVCASVRNNVVLLTSNFCVKIASLIVNWVLIYSN